MKTKASVETESVENKCTFPKANDLTRSGPRPSDFQSILSIILTIYLIILSISLEILHLIIPERTFQWSDLFGNLLGVIVVILIKNLINKYGVFKK